MEKRSALLVIFFCIATVSFAQFEGVITYHIDYSTQDEEMKEYLDAFPNRSTLTIKNHLMRFDQVLMGGGEQSLITNSGEQTTTLVMNILGRAFQVNLKADQIAQLQEIEKLRIVKTDAIKQVSGYTCRHAYAISNTDSLSIFYTPEISSNNAIPQFAELEGMPLIYEINRGKMHMTYSCEEIREQAIEDNTFKVSARIKEIPFEDFARTFAYKK